MGTRSYAAGQVEAEKLEGVARSDRVRVELERFRPRLWRAIARAGMTANQLARRSGVDPASLSRYLATGQLPSAINLALLADALGCSADHLLGRGKRKRRRSGSAVAPFHEMNHRPANAGTAIAPDPLVWVCPFCGNRARSRFGFDSMGRSTALDQGWDMACATGAVLCKPNPDHGADPDAQPWIEATSDLLVLAGD